MHLERALGRHVDVARLDLVDERAPLLLLQAINEGRAIVDRDDEWGGIQARHAEIERRAYRAHAERRAKARKAIRDLLAGDD